MLKCMPSTSVRVDRETHEELKKLARDLGTTVGEAVAIAARRLRQQRIGRDLKAPLTEAEMSWLDADLG
jgi:antitoxin component of RelBE/YafQ-DinJ toxin-antitoxin module